MTEAEQQLEGFLAPYPVHVQELTWECLYEMRKLYPRATEAFWDATQAVCLGFCFTQKERDFFFGFAVYAKHVTMIFPQGASLNDPEKRMKGEGTRIRNIRMTGIESLLNPYVLDLVQQSAEIGIKPLEPQEPIQIVKIMKGPKRRPS